MPGAGNLCSLGRYRPERGDDAQAILHYQQAVRLRADYAEAWYKLGKIYFRQKHFPLSLQAWLHSCRIHTEARKELSVLLREKRHAITEKNELIDQENLLILYDKKRRKALNEMLAKC
ncbi:MAG: tetratricopeptide repeat protein [Gammaproteobacteria bacterium]|nr:tetratricopeptide repeat protein [Gammaproteobacteria bacterium]